MNSTKTGCNQVTAYYYIKGEGGIGREFVVFEDESDMTHEYGGFKLYKKTDVNLGHMDGVIAIGVHYVKDT